jgi:anti-anti-sigma factor
MNSKGKLIINQARDEGDTIILVLKGDLDIQTAPQLRRFIDSVTREGDVNLKLDLSKLSYLDSSGYVALVDASRRTRGSQGSIDFTNMPPWLTDFFDMTALEV